MTRGLWLATALAAVGIAACGTSGSSSTPLPDNGQSQKTAAQIFQAADTALRGATAVHMSGTVSSNGQTITIDLHIAAAKKLTGTFSIAGTGSFKISTPDGTTYYMTPDNQFWSHYSAAAAQLLNGKCLSVSSADAATSFYQLATGMGQFLNFPTLLSQGANPASLTKGATTTVHGMPAIELKDPAKGSTADIATTGPPYLLEISGASGQGSLYFDQWDQPVTVATPSGCVDVAQLTQQTSASPTP